MHEPKVSQPARASRPVQGFSGARLALVLILIAVGVPLWLLAGNEMPRLRWMVVLIAVAVSLVPPVNGLLGFLLEKLRRPSQPTVRKLAVSIGAAASLYLMGTAMMQGRELFPKMEDECSYALGARLLAHGHLWMPAHPLADFFESFFILVKPVYCSIYFPGTALIFSPMAWFGWDSWVLPVVLSGAVVGMLYLVMTELVDGIAGILAAVWAVSLATFRTLSTMIMSHVPMLLLGLLMVWAFLRWRKEQRLRWALLIGLFSGMAAITRPADAVAYAVPIGVAMLVPIRKRNAGEGEAPAEPQRTGARQCQLGGSLALPFVAIIVGAAPFLALQMVFNHGVTGHVFETPYSYSLHLDQPGAEFGFHHYDPNLKSGSSLPEKQSYYDWCKPFFEQHQPHNFLRRWIVAKSDKGDLDDPYLRIIADASLPSRALLILLPVGVLGLADRRRWVLAATLPAFCLVYVFNPFFLQHYPLVIAPAMMLLVLLGCDVAANAVPKWSRYIGLPLTIGVLALATTSLWEVKWLMSSQNQPQPDGMLEFSGIGVTLKALPRRVRAPAVVLFSRPGNFFEEPVYNLDVVSPDEAPIIRAHDLGKRDVEIIRYYAAHQPERNFYLSGVQTGAIVPLGSARQLQEELESGTPIELILNHPGSATQPAKPPAPAAK